jgi:hypothetical protein
MRSIIGLFVLAVLGFYIAWPAYSGYRIKTALDTDNAELLAAKIDFDGVRQTLRPAVTAEVDKALTAAIRQGGADNEALLTQLKTQMMPKVVDSALVGVLTPETVLRMHREGGDYKATLARIISEKVGAGSLGALGGAVGAEAGTVGTVLGKLGKLAEAAGIDPGKALGGLLGKKEQGAPAPGTTGPGSGGGSATGRRPFGLANIKRFTLNGPFGYSIGIAKDATASEPDVTADLAFTGGDWKVVGIRPKS